MTRVLHVVGRWDAERPLPVAEACASNGFEGRDHPIESRVVEVFDPPAGARVVDIALSTGEVPEVMTAMHWADEIHVHGVDPGVALHRLPYVLPEDLSGTRLVVHGPWPRRVRELPEGCALRIGDWQGPVSCDEAAAECWEDGDPPKLRAPAWPSIAAEDMELLPRAGGAKPMSANGRNLAVVYLGPGLTSELRQVLTVSIAELLGPSLDIQVLDDAHEPNGVERGARRVCQAAILWAEGEPHQWPRSTVEVLAAGVPAIVVGPEHGSWPPGVVHLRDGEPQCVADRCLACLRSWRRAWLDGEAAPIDTAAARAAVITGP